MKNPLVRSQAEIEAADALPWDGPLAWIARPLSYEVILRLWLVGVGLEVAACAGGIVFIATFQDISSDQRIRFILALVGAVVSAILLTVGMLAVPAATVRRYMPLSGTLFTVPQPLLITAALAAIGPRGDAIVILYAEGTFFFYWMRPYFAAACACVAPLSYGLLLVLQPGHRDAFAHWLTMTVVYLSMGVATGWMGQRSDQLAEAAMTAEREVAALNANLAQRVEDQVEEIRDSRARIVAASDEGRRRIERNIHDGAQQQLVAILLDLRMLSDAVLELPRDGIRSQVDEARANLKHALDNLRELARGLHPSVLTTDGLEGALEQLAVRSPLPVSVVAPAERLPEQVETAAYFLAAEAVANVVKYAQASAVEIRAVHVDGTLDIAVTDDGRGGATQTPGGGLAGLADRVAAVGGTLRLSSVPGEGTTVAARLPVDSGHRESGVYP